MHRDSTGPLGNADRVGNTIETIDEDDDDGHVRGRAHSSAAEREADVRGSQSRAWLMPPDHRYILALFGRQRIDLVGQYRLSIVM